MRRLIVISLIFLLSIPSVNSVENSLLATVTINPEYSLSLEVKVQKKEVWPGRNLLVFVSLNKTTLNLDKEERITVNLEYGIKGLVANETDTMDVRTKKKKMIKIPIPTNATPGNYTVEVTASHLHVKKDAVASDEFWVKKKIVKSGFMDIIPWDLLNGLRQLFKFLV